MRIFVRQDDGTEIDVTEGVQTIYDNVLNSESWGSGFLDREEVQQIAALGAAAGFAGAEEKVQEYWQERREEEARADRNRRWWEAFHQAMRELLGPEYADLYDRIQQKKVRPLDIEEMRKVNRVDRLIKQYNDEAHARADQEVPRFDSHVTG